MSRIRVTVSLIAVMVLFFVLQATMEGFTESLYFNPSHPNPWMFVTSIFLHGGVSHLFFNILALFMFGPILESRLGERNYLLAFLACGIAGNLLYYATILLGIIPPTPALGASGSIYGVLGMLCILTPQLVIFLLFVPLPIRVATVFWIITEFLGSFDAYSGIGSAAHLGGLLFGLALAQWYVSRQPAAPKYRKPFRYEWQE